MQKKNLRSRSGRAKALGQEFRGRVKVVGHKVKVAGVWGGIAPGQVLGLGLAGDGPPGAFSAWRGGLTGRAWSPLVQAGMHSHYGS